MRRIPSIVLVCLLVAFGAWLRLPHDPAPPSLANVTRVVDGDTVYVRSGSHSFDVRLLGIDTPETVDPHRPVESSGLDPGWSSADHGSHG